MSWDVAKGYMTVDCSRVSHLRPMVKNLINQMDFDALDYKLKKCKVRIIETSSYTAVSDNFMQELFYLLESQDSVHEGGVVTANSLAIELHAGGLTKEHEVYVRSFSTIDLLA